MHACINAFMLFPVSLRFCNYQLRGTVLQGVARSIRPTNIFLTTLRFFHFSLRLLFFLPLSSRLCATRTRARTWFAAPPQSVVSLFGGFGAGGRTE